MKSDWITETIYNDLKGKANKETRAQLSLVYLWLEKIIILEMALLLNFVEFFFHQPAEIV